jgi:lambda repressor-like predicted transcriptional regulator
VRAIRAIAPIEGHPVIARRHPEDVKADLRKRFGSVARFERAHDLPEKSVNDVLRGRKSARVANAIEAALTEAPLQSSHEDSAAPANNTPAEVAA